MNVNAIAGAAGGITGLPSVNADTSLRNNATPLATPPRQPAVAKPDTPDTALNAESDDAKKKNGKASSDQLKKAAERLNRFIEPYASQLKFTVDEDTNIDVVQVIDASTKEVIRQIPSEEMLRIAKSVEKLQGLLIRQTA